MTLYMIYAQTRTYPSLSWVNYGGDRQVFPINALIFKPNVKQCRKFFIRHYSLSDLKFKYKKCQLFALEIYFKEELSLIQLLTIMNGVTRNSINNSQNKQHIISFLSIILKNTHNRGKTENEKKQFSTFQSTLLPLDGYC